MQDSNNKEKQTEKFRYGFIAIAGSEIGIAPNERVCCALVSLAGEDFSSYNVDNILFFGYNSAIIAHELQKINCKSFYIDQDQHLWLAPDWHHENNRVFRELRITSPQLISRQRDKDVMRRQANALSFIKTTPNISFATSIPKAVKTLITEPGKSVVPDAVAGAIEVCKERIGYAQAISKINSNRPLRWLGGIPRWNEKIAEEKAANNK